MTSIRPADLGIGLLFELIRDAVIVADVRTERICLWNPGAAQMFGYSAEEADGLPLEALVPQELRSAHHAGIAVFRDTGHGALVDGGEVVTVPAVTSSGERLTVELRLTPLPVFENRYVLALARDVTQREALASQLAEANTSLELALRSERDVSADLTTLIGLKDDFIAMLSHDLASPLTSVKGYTSLLRRSWDRLDPTQRISSLDAIDRATERMSALVRDLLDAARLDAGAVPYDIEDVDVGESLRQIVADLDAEQQQRITLDGPRPPYVVRADPARHGQIATNLLTNALKFSPAGTAVEVTLDTAGDRVVVSVRDHGPGVDEAGRQQLFERFRRLLPAPTVVEGTGLGLYITRRLVEDQGGVIDMTPADGGGSVFRYALPVAVGARPR